MRFGSLFAGIGGMDLGLERAGMQCAWQVEIDDYASRVLAKHWPSVPRFRDVRECGAHNLAPVDLIAGGFPCQDISNAGKRAGIEGERSGLWSEFHRITCELRPEYVLVENTTGLLGRGMGRVVGDLAASGYDAEWTVIPACAFGAPHARERVFIAAYARSNRLQGTLMGHGEEALQGGYNAGEWRTDWLKPEMGIAPLVAETWGPTFCGQIEPALLRVVNGLPSEVGAIKALGNAVVPQVAEWIGKRIMETDALTA